ncbi:MAG: NGG1p interacting factor NIF3 [Candidatus Magasanikbacteria bacterium]|nr:NGG1p interacting factor NIF3 [Candidatus Magasanikbacteria bacterium]
MTIKQIFDLGLKMAIAADPRGKKGVDKYLARVKKEYGEMKPKDKVYFEKDRLANPYADSRLHVGSEQTKVKRVLAGIDIGSGEVLLASQLNERGKPIDLIIGHHPLGRGLAGLHSVMDIQVAVFENLGMPVHIAEKLMEERTKEVARSVHPANHYQVIDLAKALKVNLMNTHTITDNLVKKFVRDYVAKSKPDTVGDLLDVLLEIPEYQEAKRRGAGPKLFAGDPSHRVGKFVVEMTGGTNPASKIYEEVSRAGISTTIGMHMRDDSRDKASEHHMNVVIAGHMSSDSLGMNLFLDELEKKGIDIVPCSGLTRVSRAKKAAKP